MTNGAFIRGPITGWVSPADPADDDSGVFNPPISAFSTEAPDGSNVAFIGGSAFFNAQPISQSLSTNLAEGSYQLRVEVGDRLDTTFAGYRIELRAGSTVLAMDNNSQTPANGTFITSLVTYTALSTNPNLGQPLGIRLLAETPGSQVQTDFDNVRLDVFPVPQQPFGDYNGNGVVDAADYVLWRKGGPLLNDPTPGVQVGDYAYWRSQFGTTSSSASGMDTAATVPEPASIALFAFGYLVNRSRLYRKGNACSNERTRPLSFPGRRECLPARK